MSLFKFTVFFHTLKTQNMSDENKNKNYSAYSKIKNRTNEIKKKLIRGNDQ